MVLFYYNLINSGDITKTTIIDYAVAESKLAGVDPQMVLYTIKEESKFNPRALNPNDKGCRSRGLVQIRDCNHSVTDEQAYNPIFAVNFLIKNINKCETWWKATCGKYVRLQKENSIELKSLSFNN